MARWAYSLKDLPQIEPIVYITSRQTDRHMDGCRERGITVLSKFSSSAQDRPVLRSDGTAVESSATGSFFQSVRRTLGRALSVIPFLGSYRRIRLQMATMSAEIASAQDLIREHRIDVVVLAESTSDYGAPLFIEAAHRQGLPVITAPIEQASSHHYAETYSTASHLSLSRPWNRAVAGFYPRWVITHKGRQSVRAPAEPLLALEWSDLAPPNPWALVGNREDVVVVDSEASFHHYLGEGVPREMMTVVGRGEHDIMARILSDVAAQKAAFYDRLKLDPKRPLLLSPLVQEHYVSGRPQCDFQSYPEMVDFWVSSLGALTTHNIVVSLHPGHTFERDPKEWKYLEKQGITLCTEDLSTLIPLCDIYVAAGSTTVQWAVACGKPVVNYDVYRYETPMILYRSAPGVLSTQEQEEFVALLRRLTTDAVYSAQIARDQSRFAENWGKLDGGAGRRFAAVIDACQRRVARPSVPLKDIHAELPRSSAKSRASQ
jgi:hypothetical protein